ncbi:MAG: DUF58 domain-containing protein [Gammaproteobacteria bacterium]|nr:DUF58 domain-containing protein [Gammaproteobacteria bacterium]
MDLNVNKLDSDDGVIHISQSRLISLQRDARLLKHKKGTIRSQFNGGFQTAFKGRGMEYDESRPYQPGDDVRNMDWRVTARTNKPYSKVFREERERPVLLWVDFRAPMFFGTQQCFKSVLAAKVAALLAWKSSQQGDRLGALLFSEYNHLELRPGTGKSSALQLMKKLSEFSVQSTAEPHQVDENKRDSRHALNRLLHVTRPGSLIYLISDFRNVSSQFESTLNRLSRHNELELIQLSDPLETHLPVEGYYRVTDGQKEVEVNAFSKQSKLNYQQRFTQHQENLKTLCKKNRIRYLSLSTDQVLLDGLMQRTAF